MSIESDLVDLQTRVYNEMRSSGLPVSSLISWLVDQRNLDAAWHRVRQADGAHTPGMDGVICKDISGASAGWLHQLADDLRHGRYRPSPPRWVNIPKNSPADRHGARQSPCFRRIGILTVRDRVVHTAIKQVLEPVLDSHFSADSFGFRPGRSVPGALQHAVDLVTSEPDGGLPFGYAVRMDIAECFETVDHTILMQQARRFVSDEAFLGLLDLLVRTTATRMGTFWNRRRAGLLTGSALSPLLCNLYLDRLDKELATAGEESHQAFRCVRYADDLLLLARDRWAARQARRAAKQALRRLHQRCHRSKGSVTPIRHGFDWLGVRVMPRRAAWSKDTRFGYIVPDAKATEMLDRLTEMTAPPSSRVDADAFDLSRWIVSVNCELRQWRQAYLYADNAPEIFRALDDQARYRLGQLLASVQGVRWREVVQRYRARLPRGFWTWEVNGVRLTALSSLAPRAPHRLTRRPVWQRCLTIRPRRNAAEKPTAAVVAPTRPPRLYMEAS